MQLIRELAAKANPSTPFNVNWNVKEVKKWFLATYGDEVHQLVPSGEWPAGSEVTSKTTNSSVATSLRRLLYHTPAECMWILLSVSTDSPQWRFIPLFPRGLTDYPRD